jgi:hypothetical protein
MEENLEVLKAELSQVENHQMAVVHLEIQKVAFQPNQALELMLLLVVVVIYFDHYDYYFHYYFQFYYYLSYHLLHLCHLDPFRKIYSISKKRLICFLN